MKTVQCLPPPNTSLFKLFLFIPQLINRLDRCIHIIACILSNQLPVMPHAHKNRNVYRLIEHMHFLECSVTSKKIKCDHMKWLTTHRHSAVTLHHPLLDLNIGSNAYVESKHDHIKMY